MIKLTMKFKIFFIFIFIFTLAFSVSASANDAADITETDDKKYIALTFDDGPHPKYTEAVLDILEEKKVAATFFVVGFRAELQPESLKRMRKLNCEIGNHTQTHADMSSDYVKNGVTSEIEKCSEAIFAATGEYPVIYRPPFGRISKTNEKKIPLRKVLWTVDSLDWSIKNKNKIINNIVKNVKDGSIVLMHDFYDSTVKALPEIIDILTGEGFVFATVSELAELSKISKLQEYFLDG
ncbi:MAG: polysaccharide deacetylase family protein [Oscillospiraceae bacterium]|nr:polysaccharide deacetylase family protein [Oscillospiraceae bacterium]